MMGGEQKVPPQSDTSHPPAKKDLRLAEQVFLLLYLFFSSSGRKPKISLLLVLKLSALRFVISSLHLIIYLLVAVAVQLSFPVSIWLCGMSFIIFSESVYLILSVHCFAIAVVNHHSLPFVVFV